MRCYFIFILLKIGEVSLFNVKLQEKKLSQLAYKKENRINIQKIKFEENMDFL